MPDRPYAGPVMYDAKDPDATFPPIAPLRPPAGAPNVLIVLLDDVGFGATSAFGGPVHTPTAERLAAGGLKYTRFHTTALCSPTRAALIGGRNHHTVGMGAITEFATSAPGYNSMRPNTCAALPEILKLNGYATAHIGKCHEVPVWETSPAGPYDRWPSPGNGFEYFYGFFGGETDQYYPTLHEGITRVEPWGTPEEGYHLTPDLTDKAIAWIGQQKSLAPDKPFFLYFAPGATHAPHHVPKAWADKYAGDFDDGWDALRERTFARQKELGVIPPDAELTARHEEIPAFDAMPENLKPALRRPHHTQQPRPRARDRRVLQRAAGQDRRPGVDAALRRRLGARHVHPVPVDQAGRVALGRHPQRHDRALAEGHRGPGRAAPPVHARDRRGADRARGRRAAAADAGQRHHAAPAGGRQPALQLRRRRRARAPRTQYFEMMCNRGVYHKGWSAVTKHRTPWITTGEVAIGFDDDVWELYDGASDWTQAHDLSRAHPDKLHELQRLFLIEATRHDVLPLDDRGFERVLSDVAGRPTLVGDKQTLLPGMGGLLEQHVVNWRNRSWSLTTLVDIPEGGAEGVILNLGGHSGGWSLYLKDGAPTFCYNLFGLHRTYVRAAQPAPAGEHQVRVEFAYDGGGIGKGGAVTLLVDGEPVATGRVDRTEPIGFGYEYTDVGRDAQSPVTSDYATGENDFTGAIRWIELEGGQDSHDHLLDPAQVFHAAMAKQ